MLIPNNARIQTLAASPKFLLIVTPNLHSMNMSMAITLFTARAPHIWHPSPAWAISFSTYPSFAHCSIPWGSVNAHPFFLYALLTCKPFLSLSTNSLLTLSTNSLLVSCGANFLSQTQCFLLLVKISWCIEFWSWMHLGLGMRFLSQSSKLCLLT